MSVDQKSLREIYDEMRDIRDDNGDRIGVVPDRWHLSVQVCGDCEVGDVMVKCNCGKHRAYQHPCGYRKPAK